MTSSSTSLNSSTQFIMSSSSFTDLLSSRENLNSSNYELISNYFTDQLESPTLIKPKFNSISPPSLTTPHSSFAFPLVGFNHSDLLDSSPVLLSPSTSNYVLASPTTGAFPTSSFNWVGDSGYYQHRINQEEFKSSSNGFSFQPEKTISKEEILVEESQPGDSYQEPESYSVEYTSTKEDHIKINREFEAGNDPLPIQSLRDEKGSDDGYNWKKYGQKQVKGSENPRSYYKCTYPNCPTKKKVERSLNGDIASIIYKPHKDSHNHPKPQFTRRSSSASAQSIKPYVTPATSEVSDHFVTPVSSQVESVLTQENSSNSIGADDFDHSSKRSQSGTDEFDDNEPKPKRWKKEVENEGISTYGSPNLKAPKVVVQTISDVDILDDGFRWRKYGQKVVKGNPNPRSYYMCTSKGCPVKKHVERAPQDLRCVITSYEGKHNHEVPATRGRNYSYDA